MAVQTMKKANDVNGISGSSSSAWDVASGRGVWNRNRDGSPQVVIKRTNRPCPSKRELLKIGTWNLRTMNTKGKLENVKEEMRRDGLNVLGISEVRWKKNDDFNSDGFRVVYSGVKDRLRGVAIVVDSKTAKRVIEVDQTSDRVIVVKLQAESVDIHVVLVQVYMPTTDHED